MKEQIASVVFGMMLALAGQVIAADDPLQSLFQKADKVIAEGTNMKLMRTELEEATKIFLMNNAAEGVTPVTDAKAMEQQILHELVFSKLTALRANTEDKSAAYKGAKEGYENQRARYSNARAFDVRIAAMGITTNAFRKRLYDEALAKGVMLREVGTQVVIVDAVVRKFYDDNLARWTTPEQVRVSQILLSTRNATTGAELSDADKAAKLQVAEGVLRRVLAGEDFGKLMAQFSDDTDTKNTRGEYTFAKGTMPAEIDRVSFAMQPGMVSRVVQTDLGYHIIRLLERKPVKVTPFEELKVVIRTAMLEEEAAKRLPDYYARLCKDAALKVHLEEK